MQEFMHIYLSIRAIIVSFHNKSFAPPILYPFSTLTKLASQLSVSNSFCLTHAGSELMRGDEENFSLHKNIVPNQVNLNGCSNHAPPVAVYLLHTRVILVKRFSNLS